MPPWSLARADAVHDSPLRGQHQGVHYTSKRGAPVQNRDSIQSHLRCSVKAALASYQIRTAAGRPVQTLNPRQIRKIRRSPDGETKSDGIHSVARRARHSDRSSRRAEDEAANGRTRNGTDQTTRPVRRLVVRASATRRRRQKAGQRQAPPPVSTRRKQRTRRLLVPVVVLSWIGTWRAAGPAPRRAEPRRVASTREATPLHSSTPVSPLRLRAALDRAPPQHLSACTLWPSTCFPSAHAAAVVVVGIHYSFGHEHTAMPYVMPCNQPHVVQIH